MILTSQNQSLQALLAGAVSANQLPCHVEFADQQHASGNLRKGSNRVNTNGATAVTLAAAPQSGIDRDIKHVSIFNADTAAATVTVRINDNGTYYTLFKAVLQVGETLVYSDEGGWRVLTGNGVQKTGLGSSPGMLLSKIAHFDSAQVIASNTTPLVVLDFSAMLAAGEVEATDTLVFFGALLQMDGGAAAYDQNQNTIAKYQTAGGGAAVSLTLANFFNGAADNAMSTLKPIATDVVPEAAQDIVLTSSASPKSAAGDRALNVEVFYSIYKRV